MSFQFRRRRDAGNVRNNQDPYFDQSVPADHQYQDYQNQPNIGYAPQQQQGYDPRYNQQPIMPNGFGNMPDNGQMHPAYQFNEPNFAPHNYDAVPHNAYAPNLQQDNNQRYHPSAGQAAFTPSQHQQFEPAPYMHPFHSSQMPTRNNFVGNSPYQQQNTEKNKQFSFLQGSNVEQQTGFDDHETEVSSPVKLLVSVVGVAILAALSWFAYKWVKAPSSDSPPLIMADEGPHKIRPDHKGGVNIPYQDKLIYDRISDAEQPEERLLPPPETPEEMYNQPMQAPDGMQLQQQQPVASQQIPAQQQYTQPMVAQQQYVPNQQYQQQPQYQQPVNSQNIQMQNQPVYNQQPQQMNQNQAMIQQPQVVNNVVESEKEKPATTVRGTFFVQIATVKSEEAALREWKRLKNKYGLQNQKSQVKEFETTDGDTVFRLLMGPFDDKVKALKHAVKIDGSKIVQMTE